MSESRTPEYPVDPIFLNRWSPRAFTGEAIPEQTLLSILEAARWSPSAYNLQPWRFIWARAGTPAWGPLLATLNEFNQSWARNASALLVVLSAKTGLPPGATEPQPNGWHAFDTGAAWLSAALQATSLGWHAHAMAGFDKDLARSSLGVPDDFAVDAVVAIGRLSADKSALPEALRARDNPTPRLPLAAIAAEGRFGFKS
ncbi:nitroreductase family protein [Ramlibacter sp. H39-3-26]|uniref:nitroreductase family protein n=1 Tax=Curvibacter soli TaxID=3031331 RepID=UPI0023D980AB|nr:nitroreductase family protein [Ramlibacter sp. H39-3-26]MDF1483988.1 nitroreductase family protein [Ramlibacter sp. H39-3-26]